MFEGIIVPIILILIGAAAFFLEVFVPSGGLISVMAVACTVAAICLAFSRQGVTVGLSMIMAALILIPTSLILALRAFPKTRIGKRLILAQSQTKEEGFISQDKRELDLIGKTGIVVTMLRPVGAARINGSKYDVMTEGELVEKGAEIEVRRVEGNRIVVRKIKK